MKERILEDLKTAMKKQDKEALSVIRMVKGSIQMEELNKKRELNDEEIISVIDKQIKMRKESIIEFEKGNRPDLVEKTNAEIEILNEYMPEPLSSDEVNKIIEDTFLEIQPTSIRDMGKIMNALNPKLKGRTDMGKVSSIIKNKLNNI